MKSKTENSKKLLRNNKLIRGLVLLTHYMRYVTLFLMFLLISISRIKAQNNNYSSIQGYVTNVKGEPIIGANVYLLDVQKGGITNDKGFYSLDKIIFGTYDIRFSCIGYRERTQKIICEEDSVKVLNVVLTELIYKMKDVVVSPSSFFVSKNEDSRYSFSSKELENLPDPSDDVIRKMQLIAGVESDNFNARFGVRGSYFDDMIYTIDGMEVYDPFHMKSPPSSPLQLEGLISIVSDEIVESVDLLLGGFSAKYGNKSGGVMNIHTLNKLSQEFSGNISLSLMNAGVQLTKSYSNHTFLLSLRRGYFDFLVNLLGAETNVVPNYYDLYFKYFWKINNSNTLFFNYLSTHDNYIFKNLDTDKEKAKLKENINYFWLGWEFIGKKFFTNRLLIGTSLLPNDMTWDESDVTFIDKGENIQDVVDFRISNDSYLEFFEWYGLEAGVTARYTENNYEYNREYNFDLSNNLENDKINVSNLYTGYTLNLYLSNKIRLTNNLLFEGGIRYDYQSYFKNGNSNISPRFAISYKLPYSSIVRLAYGYYYQPTNIANLNDYIDKDYFKVNEGIHYIVGLENNYINNLTIRLEGYYKDLEPSAEYIRSINKMYALEDSYAKGIDLLVKYSTNNFLIRGSYSLSTTRDVAIGGEEFYRVMDKTHRLSLFLSYKIGTWTLGINSIFTSGYPYTSLVYVPFNDNTWTRIYGEYNAAREEPFQRIDFSASKEFHTTLGKILLQLEIINLFNSESIYERRWAWKNDNNGNRYPYEDNSKTFPFVPSIGLKWKF